MASEICKLSLKSTLVPGLAIAEPMPHADPLSLYDRLIAVKPRGLSENAWTVRAGVSRAAFTDIKRRGNARHDTVVKLLDAIGLTFAEFEAGKPAEDKEPPTPAVRAPRMAFQGQDRPRDVPILGTAECSDMEFSDDGMPLWVEAMSLDLDEVVDYARRPATLDNRRDVYAIYFRGHSMAPRYEPGEIAYVDPRRAPRLRDYVVVQLRRAEGEDEERVFNVLAKRLVRQTAAFYELEQFNPPTTFRVDAASVKHIHRIIPWDELVSF